MSQVRRGQGYDWKCLFNNGPPTTIKTMIFFREPPNKHFYQEWFKLAKGFKRRRLITENTHFDTFGSLVSVAYL
jgi:hypothetical protein